MIICDWGDREMNKNGILSVARVRLLIHRQILLLNGSSSSISDDGNRISNCVNLEYERIACFYQFRWWAPHYMRLDAFLGVSLIHKCVCLTEIDFQRSIVGMKKYTRTDSICISFVISIIWKKIVSIGLERCHDVILNFIVWKKIIVSYKSHKWCIRYFNWMLIKTLCKKKSQRIFTIWIWSVAQIDTHAHARAHLNCLRILTLKIVSIKFLIFSPQGKHLNKFFEIRTSTFFWLHGQAESLTCVKFCGILFLPPLIWRRRKRRKTHQENALCLRTIIIKPHPKCALSDF